MVRIITRLGESGEPSPDTSQSNTAVGNSDAIASTDVTFRCRYDVHRIQDQTDNRRRIALAEPML